MPSHLNRRLFLAHGSAAALAASFTTSLTAAGLPARAHAAPPRYLVTDLGDLGGRNIFVHGLNDLGVSTGVATRHDDDAKGVAFKSQDGAMFGIPWDGRSTVGEALNNNGVIAGQNGGRFGTPAQAWIWSHKQFTNIGDPEGLRGYTAYDINDAGQVTGSASTGDAYLWQDGEMRLLPKLKGFLGANGNAVNSQGDVVGNHIPKQGDLGQRAFTCFDGKMLALDLPGVFSHAATDVNDARQVCGGLRHEQASPVRGFVWHDGQLLELPPLDGDTGSASSNAAAINQAGVVVGIGTRPNGTSSYGFVWQDGVMHDLNTLVDASTPGWKLMNAVDINQRGQIVGQGRFNGVKRAYLATPVLG